MTSRCIPGGSELFRNAAGMPLIPQLLDLILHEGDERRDDHRQPTRHRRGKLKAKTLARARRHDAKHIAAGEDVFDDLPLSRAKFVEAEMFLKLLAKIGHS